MCNQAFNFIAQKMSNKYKYGHCPSNTFRINNQTVINIKQGLKNLQKELGVNHG